MQKTIDPFIEKERPIQIKQRANSRISEKRRKSFKEFGILIY